MRCHHLIFLFLLTAFLLPSPSFSAPERQPRLVIDKVEHDAGTLVEGEKIRHTFLIKNLGTGPLIISGAEKDCPCTKVAYDSPVLPGHVGRVWVTFNTAGEEGPRVKTVRLHTNDPEKNPLALAIKAKILKALSVTPARVFFKGGPGQEQTQIVRISAPEGKAVTLSLLKSELGEQLGFYIEKPKPPAAAWQVHIRHRGERAGISRGRIILETDIPYQPRITIPVYARILDPVALIPSRIDFGRMKLARYKEMKKETAGPVRAVNIKAAGKTPPKIASLVLDDPKGFKTRIRPLNRIGAVRIELEALPDQFEPGLFETRMHIRLFDREDQSLTVPVRLEFF